MKNRKDSRVFSKGLSFLTLYWLCFSIHNLLVEFHRCEELQLLKRCVSIKPRDATEEELLKLHSPDMITKLKSTDKLVDEAALEELSSHYDFIFIDPV